MENKLYRVVSLFSGIGGFEHGIQKSNIKSNIVFSSEIDSFAVKTYSLNFNIDTMHGDITKISEDDIPEHDILCAGFPCQSFSIAGKRLGFEDTRGTLFFDVARILKKRKPKIFLLENVKNIISHDNSKTINVILNTLSSLGYTIDFSIINSKEAGLPQNRERWYCIGVMNAAYEPFEDDKRNIKVTAIKKALNQTEFKSFNFFNNLYFSPSFLTINDILEPIENGSKYHLNSLKLANYLSSVNLVYNKEKKNEIIKLLDLPREVHNDLERQRRVYSIYGISPTILARSDTTKILIKNKNNLTIRKLSPIETLKAQGFDYSYIKNVILGSISDTRLYKQSGNAVSPPVITEIINLLSDSEYV